MENRTLFRIIFSIILIGNVILGMWNYVKGDAVGSFISSVIILLILMVFLVQYNAKKRKYRCRECGREFEVTDFSDFIASTGHGKGGSAKQVKCPKCGNMTGIGNSKKSKQ